MAGQSVIPILVSAREKILDRDAYNGARSINVETAGAEGTDEKVSVPVPTAA
ncbi:hypothetical protein [Streptomyces nigrescens]|uniref:hypothetical protein n=1 Tax=Streptomyces nigrescens TaxID=1920 RepID=UPI0034780570